MLEDENIFEDEIPQLNHDEVEHNSESDRRIDSDVDANLDFILPTDEELKINVRDG